MAARTDAASLTPPALDSLDKAFPSPFRGEDDSFSAAIDPRSLVELAMCRLSAAIRSKADWRSKRHDVHIVEKWRTEALALSPLLSPAAIQYVLDELGWYDGLLEAETGCSMSVVDGVWQSDTLLGSELTGSMQRAVAQCWGELTDEQRDWHPGSERVVWDMVHPSLYPLVAGRTRVVAEESADVAVERSVDAIGGGRVLGVAEYGRRMQQQAAALKVQGDRWQHVFRREPDSDDEAAAQQQAVAAGEEQPEQTAEQKAEEAEAAWRAGKIALVVQVPVARPAGVSTKGQWRNVAVYVQPDARLADVRAQAAAHMPKGGVGDITLTRGDSKSIEKDEQQPLYALGIRSGSELTAAQELVTDKAALAAAERDKKAKAAFKPIRIEVATQGVRISVHRLDQSATVDTLLQQLCEGSGEARGSCYPAFARGVPPFEQRVSIDAVWGQPNRKRLLPHHTFAYYQLCNGRKVKLSWHRVTEEERATEGNTIELRMIPLRSEKLPAMLLDVAVDDPLWWVREVLSTSLPGHHRWERLPPAQLHVYYPATSQTELSDDTATLSALGIGVEQREAEMGMRWTGDDAAKVEDLQADDVDMEVEPTVGENEAEGDEMAEQDNLHTANADEQPQPAVQEEADQLIAGEEELKQDEVELMILMGDYFGPNLRLTVRTSATVREVKERIMRGQVDDSSTPRAKAMGLGVPVAQQRLTLSRYSKLMGDARTLAFYGVDRRLVPQITWENTAEVEMPDDDPAPPTIELSLLQRYGGKPDDTEPEREVIDCVTDETVGELRRRIVGRMGAGGVIDKVRLRRAVGEPVLSDEQTLAEVGLTDGDTLVVDYYTTSVRVTLVLPSGGLSSFSLIADGSTTVRELKERIAARPDGYAVEWQWADWVVEAREFGARAKNSFLRTSAPIDDDQPLSHYGAGLEKDEKVHMLVCHRAQPRAAQHDEQEAAEQPQQLLRLHVCSALTNDIHAVRAQAWQPLVAVRWQLAWMKAEAFDAQRLSLCPPAASPSTARQYAATSRPLTSADDYTSLQSLGVTDGRVLQLDRSEVPLAVQLSVVSQTYPRPLGDPMHDAFILHAQLDDTVAEVKVRLHSLVDMPADRMLFRFHRLLTVEAQDSMTLRQLGFTARGLREKFVQHSWAAGYLKQNELTVCLLSQPATQPPSIEQQRANGLVHVGVRMLAHSGRVHRKWLLRDETVDGVRLYLWHLYESALKAFSPRRDWDHNSVTIVAGGRKADDGSKLSELLDAFEDELPIIDVLVRFEEEAGADEGGDDDGEEEEQTMEVDEAEDGENDADVDEKGGQNDEHKMGEVSIAHSGEEHDMEDEKSDSQSGAHPMPHQAEPRLVQEAGAAMETTAVAALAVAVANRGEGQHFCLHPEHPLYLEKPYVSGDVAVLEWYCDVCTHDRTFTPDGRCWHCEQCRYDVCQLCFSRASKAADGQAADSTDGGTASEEQQPTMEGEDGDGSGEDASNKAAVEYHTSARYAWLPADFHIGHDGTARCLSYINSLHPVQHAVMYDRLERVVACFVPLFERVLTSLRHPRPPKVPVGSWYWPVDEERHERQRADKRRRLSADVDDDDEEWQQWEQSKPIHQPDVPPFEPPPPPPSTVSLRGRRLQIIVKLASVMLTPDRPHYAGGVWHVEGMRNECIVASGIAYYEQANIGPSSLAFRCAVTEPVYEQNDNRGVEAVYGLRNEQALVQPLGAVDTCAGRCLAFPNLFQHRVAPFSLLDPAQPGHRSICVLFLVDPAVPVLSSSRVPPQQAEWAAASEYAECVSSALGGVRVLSEVVDAYVDWPMKRAEAEQHRAQLMHERKYFVQENTATVYEREFSLCEH